MLREKTKENGGREVLSLFYRSNEFEKQPYQEVFKLRISGTNLIVCFPREVIYAELNNGNLNLKMEPTFSFASSENKRKENS